MTASTHAFTPQTTLAEAWDALDERACWDLADDERAMMRGAFYTGARALLSLFMMNACGDEQQTVDKLQALNRELDRYVMISEMMTGGHGND